MDEKMLFDIIQKMNEASPSIKTDTTDIQEVYEKVKNGAIASLRDAVPTIVPTIFFVSILEDRTILKPFMVRPQEDPNGLRLLLNRVMENKKNAGIKCDYIIFAGDRRFGEELTSPPDWAEQRAKELFEFFAKSVYSVDSVSNLNSHLFTLEDKNSRQCEQVRYILPSFSGDELFIDPEPKKFQSTDNLILNF